MGIKIRNQIDFGKVQKDLQGNLKRELEIALNDEAVEIIQRTRAGTDAVGRKFESYAPYDPAYKKYKQKKGRKGNIDLTFTGAMLAAITSAIQVMSDKLIGRIYFSSAREAEKAGYNMVENKRQFFGLSKEQAERLTKRLKEALRK